MCYLYFTLRQAILVYLYKTYYAKLSTSFCSISIVKRGHLLLFIFRSPHKKRTETQNSVVLSSTLLLLHPLDEQQRKRNFLFFSFVSSCLTLSPPPHLPKHCQNPKPNATPTPSWWKYQGSHALQTAPYWPPYLAPWQARVASLPIRHNRTGQGRSHSPYPYKYHKKRTKEGRKKKTLLGTKKMRRRRENIEKSNGGKQREIRKRKEEVGVSAQGKKRTVATATVSLSRTFASRLNVAASSTANTKEQKEKNRKIEGRRRDSRRKVEGKYREGGRTTSSVHRKPLSVLLFAHCQQQHRHRMSASPSFIFLFSFSTCNLYRLREQWRVIHVH